MKYAMMTYAIPGGSNMNLLPINRGRGRHIPRTVIGISLLLLAPAPAHAGMPTILLTDMARMRIQTISFFLLGILLSSAFIQWIWNSLRKDFTVLPRLSYAKALCVVTMWGLLFVLVLTMIAGARELMTPGAWEKQGKTYRLAQPPEPAPSSTEDSMESARFPKLESLRRALWEYADTHQGHFPSERSDTAIPADKWRLPDPSGLRYLYVGGLQAAKQGSLSSPNVPLAYEPEFYDSGRLVLFTDGHIQRMENGDLDRALHAEKP
jgi:hypothetical protein